MQLISIIVPVFNNEDTLLFCVKSILGQTYKNFELLLIDDGSGDSSPKICDDLSTIDSRIRVFHQINGGASSARNTGLDNAKGEWITFVDADDWVSKNWLELYVDKFDEAELIVQKIIPHGANFNTERQLELMYSGDAKEGVIKMFNTFMFGAVWNKLFRTRILRDNNIRFNEDIHFREDEVFVLSYCTRINNIYVSEVGGYNYIVPNMTRKYGDVDNFNTLCLLYTYVVQLGIPYEEHIHESYLRELTNSLFDSLNKGMCSRYRFKRYMRIVHSNFLKMRSLSYVSKIIMLLPVSIAYMLLVFKSKVTYYGK